MKTSIIVSTFAALSIMITLGEAPTLRNSENSNVMAKADYSVMPANILDANPVIIIAAATKKIAAVKVSATATEDYSYLKFNAAAYLDENEMTIEPNAENSFDYLKFDVDQYNENDELSAENANEFSYLKFNVNAFNTENKTVSNESVEFPVIEFDHLKFDVDKFNVPDNIDSSETTELPTDEFNYLKFNVNIYSVQDTPDAVLISSYQ